MTENKLHKCKAKEKQVCDYDFIELVAYACYKVWLHRATHSYPIHLYELWGLFITYDGFVNNHEHKDSEHGIEYSFVVRLLDPRIILNKIEQWIPGCHNVSLHENSLLYFQFTSRSCMHHWMNIECLYISSILSLTIRRAPLMTQWRHYIL